MEICIHRAQLYIWKYETKGGECSQAVKNRSVIDFEENILLKELTDEERGKW